MDVCSGYLCERESPIPGCCGRGVESTTGAVAVVASIVRSDCYRLERQLPGGIRTRCGMAPCHGAPKSYAKDSDGYKVVNCTRAQPVFHRFGRLARGKVIAVTVLSW